MRKLIAAINMTLDGFCDHTAIPANEGMLDEMHQHYNDLLHSADAVLYGRITYQLMQYWQTVVKNPTGNKPTDEFAVSIDNITKVVFSHTLKDTGWETARLAKNSLKEEILELKQQPGRDILVGSPSLIAAAMALNLVDEYQLFIHPIVAGNGLRLFKDSNDKHIFKLIRTKAFNGGVVCLYYVPA